MNTTINFDRIISAHLNALINAENLNIIKLLANEERPVMGPNKAEEIAFGNKYSELTNTEKAVLAANIALTDEQVGEILGNNPIFEFEYLNHYIKLVNYFKYKGTRDLTMREFSAKRNMDNYTRLLINQFAKYVGAINPEIIINKINEILSFNPEILSIKNCNIK